MLAVPEQIHQQWLDQLVLIALRLDGNPVPTTTTSSPSHATEARHQQLKAAPRSRERDCRTRLPPVSAELPVGRIPQIDLDAAFRAPCLPPGPPMTPCTCVA